MLITILFVLFVYYVIGYALAYFALYVVNPSDLDDELAEEQLAAQDQLDKMSGLEAFAAISFLALWLPISLLRDLIRK